MEQLISRQQAIDALWAERTKHDEEMERNLETCSFALRADNKARRNRVEEDIKIIRQLPPAQFATDTNVGIKLGTNLVEVGTDCISRQAAINALDECYCGGEDSCGEPWIYKENAVEAINMIEPLPPTEPQIIRCKDCKHWIPYDWMFSEIWQSKNIADYPEDEIGCNWSDMAMKANDFCSRAERRTE